MDPNLQALTAQLADAAIRNTAGAITDRITAVKARKQDQATIAELEEIISGLVIDKAELVRIARVFQDELVAEQISQNDLKYITENLLPTVKQLVEMAADENDGDASSTRAMIDLLQPILSIETVTVLQLIGFNFRRAIGQPLTELVARLIMANAQSSTDLGLEVQKLAYEREIAYFAVARDPEAFARLRSLGGEDS